MSEMRNMHTGVKTKCPQKYCNLRKMEEEGILSGSISDDELSNLYRLHSVVRILK
jgi:hypothetical protein